MLPRKSTLVRRRAGTPQAQVLCANLDLALLVLSLEPNFAEAQTEFRSNSNGVQWSKAKRSRRGAQAGRKQRERAVSESLFLRSQGMVDRVLVSAHAQGLEVAIVLNKAPS